MLYLDSSALVKHYHEETGTQTLERRLRREAEHGRVVFTSALTYAETHAVLARLLREKRWSSEECATIQDRFDSDWASELTPIELSREVLRYVREALSELPLRGADAVHLASALWLRDIARFSEGDAKYGEPVVFVSADRQLVRAAGRHRLDVFNPEIN